MIIHEVPKRPVSQVGENLELSDIESSIDQQLRNYFHERITGSLTRAASDVVVDLQISSPVPSLVAQCIDEVESNFVEASRQMARHLYLTQTGVNPQGLLVVIQGMLPSVRCLAVLKLEREDGVQAKPKFIDGKRTFDIEHIRQLMLTSKTKVFKVGLFWRGSDGVEGLVADEQRSQYSRTGVADFFLRQFLGCQYRVSPDVSTQRFYSAVQEFIDNDVHDPLSKTNYQISLLAEMNSNSVSIDPRRFAENQLQLHERRKFEERLDAENLSMATFTKDTSRIRTVLNKVEIDFTSGIIVMGPPETFDKNVRMTDAGEGRTRLEIEDTIDKVRGKR